MEYLHTKLDKDAKYSRDEAKHMVHTAVESSLNTLREDFHYLVEISSSGPLYNGNLVAMITNKPTLILAP